MALDWNDEQQATYDGFNDLVNLAPKEMEEWLETDESKSGGHTREGDDEAIGHQSGRRIVRIKRTKKADLTEGDLDHMQKVVGYIRRHKAQVPRKETIATSDWRYSLMNWGHDPCKEGDIDC